MNTIWENRHLHRIIWPILPEIFYIYISNSPVYEIDFWHTINAQP